MSIYENAKMLTTTKTLLGISSEDTSKDALISTLLDQSFEEAMSYCRLKSFDYELSSTVCKMAVQKYNRHKTEGLAAQSYSGVSESYIDGYSADIVTILKRYRKVRFL